MKKIENKLNLGIKLNYFNFKKFSNNYLITNDMGRYAFLSIEEFDMLLNDTCNLKEEVLANLTSKYFIYNNKELFVNDASKALKETKKYLDERTQLHIFVLTTYCNLSCVYCQASAFNNSNKCTTEVKGKFMSAEVAERSVDLALQSTSNDLIFEFQGGEPLANFKILKHIVEYTNKRNKLFGKNITFNLVTNLTLITEEMIKFLRENDVSICTSIDGPEIVHNENRRYDIGNCLKTITNNINKINKYNNSNLNFVQAIQTTTKHSLDHGKAIVDEYVNLKFNSIFIRPLTPTGHALKNWEEIGYTTEEFLKFYGECLDYIIELSSNGINIVEGHALIFLRKILRNIPVNYMELRSPCGGVIGQLAYNYDGNIYTCDEGRMLAETGDLSFKLGDVYTSNISDLSNCSICKSIAVSSCLESIPGCEQCAYSPYCGVCPVCNYVQYNSLFSQTPNNYKCKIYKGILDILFFKLLEGKSETINTFNKWLTE